MDIVIVLLVCIVALLGFGVGVEKLLHPEFSLYEASRKLKQDIKTICKGIFYPTQVRFSFHPLLWDSFRAVLKPYTNDAFEIYINAIFESGAPCIHIHFIPKGELASKEVVEISNLLLLKFREYISNRNKSWNSFSCCSGGRYGMDVFIYYCEWEEDKENYIKCYCSNVKDKVSPDYGIIRDDQLDKELAKWKLN